MERPSLKHLRRAGTAFRRNLGLLIGVCSLVAASASSHVARAQIPSIPVFVDDSARAVDAMFRAGELTAIGNLTEAAKVYQSLLEEEGERLVATPADPDLFVSVRSRVMAAIAGAPTLLVRYRLLEQDAAQLQLDAGEIERVERTRLLTPAGYEAALRLTQQAIEAAQFGAASLMLAQLDAHPDRQGESGRGALAMLRLLASYSAGSPAHDEILARLARWEGERATNAPQQRERPEAISATRVLDELPDAALSGILERPLWSDAIGDRLPLTPSTTLQKQQMNVPDDARWLFILPTVVGENVYVNDFQTLTAWNRFTLSQKWRVRFESADPRTYTIGPQGGIREMAQVACDGRSAIALMGLAIENSDSISRQLVCIDARTGATRWTRRLSDLRVPDTQSALLTGPAVLDQDVAIVLIRKEDPGRRVDGLVAVGIDAARGERLWHRTLGSTGSLAYGLPPGVTDTPLVRNGVMYAVSYLGFVAAVETVSGRTRWIRRLPAGPATSAHPDEPWSSNTPVLADGALYLVHPSRQQVLKLSASTGEVIATIASSRLDTPGYLIRAGDSLLGVAEHSIVAVSLEEFGPDAPTRRIAQITGSSIRGRVVSSGGRALVPVADGLKAFDPTSPDMTPVQSLPLAYPGTALPVESQLLVVDDRRIHTYLLWETADKMLREQIASNPKNASPAITHAELAYRAGRPEVILEAVDRALAAIESDPLGEGNAQNQSRLFKSLFEMIEPPQLSQDAELLDLALRGELIDRLERSASSFAETLSYLLVKGSFLDASGQPARAVEAYQSVLDSPQLSSAMFSQGETIVSGQFEATRRLRRVVGVHGAALYDAYQADASRLLSEAAADLDPQNFERIARRYPVSRAAVTAWIEAARRYETAGRPKLAGQALREGFDAAVHGLEKDDPLCGELAGRLVKHLTTIGLLHEARSTLRSHRLASPGLAFTIDGQTQDDQAMLADIESRLRAAMRRPEIGRDLVQTRQLLGWAVLEPLTAEAPARPRDRLLMISDQDEIALWAAKPGTTLTKLWGGVRNEIYVAPTSAGILTAAEIGQGEGADYSFIMRHADTGEVLWRSRPFREHLPRTRLEELLDAEPNAMAPRIDTPLDIGEIVTRIVIAIDQSTLVAIDRIGRAVGFDLTSGTVLWKHEGLVPRLHSVALDAGTLLVGGAVGPIDFENRFTDRHAADPMPALAVVLDARSGVEVTRWTHESARVRWVRLSTEGLPILGLSTGVIALDPHRGTPVWNAGLKELRGSLAGWTVPGQVIVRDELDRLWSIASASGNVEPERIDTKGRMSQGFSDVTIQTIEDAVALITRLGIVMLGGDLKPVGADANEHSEIIDHASIADRFAVTLAPAEEDPDPGLRRHTLHVLELPSLKIVSRAHLLLPINTEIGPCELIDGHLLITTGAVVTVAELPTTPAGEHAPQPPKMEMVPVPNQVGE